jgi:hypothetical protein
LIHYMVTFLVKSHTPFVMFALGCFAELPYACMTRHF